MIVVFFAATAPTNAGSYQVVASATAGTNYNAATSAAYTFTITPANACGTYTGEYFKNTTYATGGSTYIRLSVVLNKPVTASGDIATATVNFTITPQAGSGVTIPGIRILNSSTETATFYLNYKVDLSSTILSKSITVAWSIGGNYKTGSSCPYNTIVITVSAPVNDFVTGGGFIIPTNSGGTRGGTPVNGLKNNFGFNLKSIKLADCRVIGILLLEEVKLMVQ